MIFSINTPILKWEHIINSISPNMHLFANPAYYDCSTIKCEQDPSVVDYFKRKY